MASSTSAIPLALECEWYKIRDTLFGDNRISVKNNLEEALRLAATCEHPEAKWLISVAGSARTTQEAAEAFRALGSDNAKATCFAWMMGVRRDLLPLQRSAAQGFAFAQAWLAGRLQGEERFKLSLAAAEQGEREGFLRMGYCWRDGEGTCEVDRNQARKYFALGVERNCIWSCLALAPMLHDDDVNRWTLWGKAAKQGETYDFLRRFTQEVQRFNAGEGDAATVFEIGRVLHGQINVTAESIFNDKRNFSRLIKPALQAVQLYEAQIVACRKAVDNWTLVGIRLRVVKDIRKVIGKLIWDARGEAKYHLS